MAITQSLGRVSVIPRGEYNETTQYEKLDLVKFRGSSYLALKTSVGNLPTDENYFQLIAEKGDTGETGPTGQTGERGLPGRDVSSIVMTNEGVNHPITAIYSDGTEQAIGNIKDGSGGDMYAAIYDTDGDGVVDYAESLSDGENNIIPRDVLNKANKTDVYTKTEVDEKILINSTSNDFAINEKNLELSAAAKNKLSVSLVGDKYDSSYEYSKDDLCIENNIVYRSLVNHNIGNAVTNTSYFTPTTLGNEFGALKNTLSSDLADFKIVTVWSTASTEDGFHKDIVNSCKNDNAGIAIGRWVNHYDFVANFYKKNNSVQIALFSKSDIVYNDFYNNENHFMYSLNNVEIINVNIEASSNISLDNNGYLRCYKCGKQVTFEYRFTVNNSIGGVNTMFSNLPKIKGGSAWFKLEFDTYYPENKDISVYFLNTTIRTNWRTVPEGVYHGILSYICE